ncbi:MULTISPECIES: DUF2852 domain-containing protein [unclassified Aureimonas]|uniref:DUF2852 domain-containing protein n=1 Tax=unclassified Aureimonas TaxID=2615206 RepID=UPI0006F45991|nr:MULTISPECIES: DUF2852 domain-containing protein [unclassified Aureimonas]KQT64402.1 hypothetical protein ASG62_05390 [Aureimonas sp. Leaf427]KQT81592.1 hypothetical protein ASG54_02670 [Aureimonas sp. Leaf460]
MTSHALIRPAWTPATIALMVGGFMLYWPLGLAVLAYILWGERLEGFRRDVNRSTDRFADFFRANGGGRAMPFASARTGNVAFDDWRERELSRLDEERRKLNEAHAEFESYARELRRAKDQEEFDRFMSARRDRGTARDRSGASDATIIDA